MSDDKNPSFQLLQQLKTSQNELQQLKQDIISSFGIDPALSVSIRSYTDCFYKFNKNKNVVFIYNSENVEEAIKQDKPKTMYEYENSKNIVYSADKQCVGILIPNDAFARLATSYVLCIFDVKKEIGFTENSVGALIEKLRTFDPTKTILVQLTINGKTYNSGKLSIEHMGDRSGFVSLGVIADNIVTNESNNNTRPTTVGELKALLNGLDNNLNLANTIIQNPNAFLLNDVMRVLQTNAGLTFISLNDNTLKELSDTELVEYINVKNIKPCF